jgi:hypothetical protein
MRGGKGTFLTNKSIQLQNNRQNAAIGEKSKKKALIFSFVFIFSFN